MNLPPDVRTRLALDFAARASDLGVPTLRAIAMAAARYDVAAEDLLDEWLRRLLAKVVADQAIEKARA
ncbi:MAG: hypothetical protein A3G81_26115 [Betaproteobacteria bacterium RIFCSPLOWO2_12_FULL_65_14]|nr:MAG: hypothetical protein A3G81_26115 [Betaproteobacteria bacterium RIFCSPLOWO2_12_FULL_65_14]